MKGRLYKVLSAGVLAGTIFFLVLTFASVDTFREKKDSVRDRYEMHYFSGTIVMKPEKDKDFCYVDDAIISGATFVRSEDAYLLAKIAMAEAESEDTEGKALVILVVLNRVKADGFPDSIEEVIYQTRQFSPVSNGRFDRVEPDEDCWKALAMIEMEVWDESMGATYFESKSESEWHEENLRFLFQYGSHYFYTDKEAEDD